jgi:hypothetical protein
MKISFRLMLLAHLSKTLVNKENKARWVLILKLMFKPAINPDKIKCNRTIICMNISLQFLNIKSVLNKISMSVLTLPVS